jgi:hypothetical protein
MGGCTFVSLAVVEEVRSLSWKVDEIVPTESDTGPYLAVSQRDGTGGLASGTLEEQASSLRFATRKPLGPFYSGFGMINHEDEFKRLERYY